MVSIFDQLNTEPINQTAKMRQCTTRVMGYLQYSNYSNNIVGGTKDDRVNRRW